MKEIRVIEGKVVAPEGMKVAIVASRFNEIIVNKLLGGAEARSPVGGRGFPHPNQVVKVENLTITQLGPDYLLEGEVRH